MTVNVCNEINYAWKKMWYIFIVIDKQYGSTLTNKQAKTGLQYEGTTIS